MTVQRLFLLHILLTLLDVHVHTVVYVSLPLQALEEPSDRDKFSPMLPSMLSVLGATLNSGDEASAQEVLAMLIQVGAGLGFDVKLSEP